MGAGVWSGRDRASRGASPVDRRYRTIVDLPTAAVRGGLLALALSFLVVSGAAGQQLLPRAYWPMPVGTNVLTTIVGRSEGDFVSGGAVPITDGSSRMTLFQVSYARSFSLAGRTATVVAMAPYLEGTAEGVVDGVYRRRELSALADLGVRLTVNLAGAPTMDGAQFMELLRNPRTQVGLSLEVLAPTGGYDGDRLINEGSNRWSARPAVGFIVPTGRGWAVELELAANFYGDNDDYLGSTREQEPLLAASSHFVYRVARGFWASLDTNFYTGGRTSVDGLARDDEQESARIGATAYFPFKKRHAVRVAFSTPVQTKFGGDFDLASLTYQFLWR